MYLETLDSDGTFAYKWIGFLLGIGMAHQWPAVRIGGVKPPVPTTLSIPFDLAAVAGSASVQIKLTEPSSAVSSFRCSSSPCQVQVDRRQGSPWYEIVYLNPKGAVLKRSQPELLSLN